MDINKWFPDEYGFKNFFKPEKFLEYNNIVELGQRYPDTVKSILGENKVLFTPKDDPTFFVFLVKSENVPSWAKEKGFQILKVT